MKSYTSHSGLVVLVAMMAAFSSGQVSAAEKPPAAECEAAAIIDANSMEYLIADYEGRLSPEERTRWSADQLAEFERKLTALRPQAAIARSVADALEKVDVTDAQFDSAEDLDGEVRQAFIGKCHAAYVK